MAIDVYLGLTEGEIRKNADLPRKSAWMACHFSSNSAGISNLPRRLPEESLLILDDSTPIQGHDPLLVRDMLTEAVRSWRCSALLLDFQRPGAEEMVGALHEALP